MQWNSYLLKEKIPELTYTETYGVICRDNVEFYQGVHNEYNCDAKVSPILTNIEADCMTHNGRKIWYLSNELTGDRDYYMYYDDIWRFWIIHSRFTDIEQEWNLRCLLWDEYEPFNCIEWYTVDTIKLLSEIMSTFIVESLVDFGNNIIYTLLNKQNSNYHISIIKSIKYLIQQHVSPVCVD